MVGVADQAVAHTGTLYIPLPTNPSHAYSWTSCITGPLGHVRDNKPRPEAVSLEAPQRKRANAVLMRLAEPDGYQPSPQPGDVKKYENDGHSVRRETPCHVPARTLNPQVPGSSPG